MKDAVRVAHAELASRNYMIRLKDMSTKDQVVIMAALFRHFDPWIIGAGTSIKSQQIR